jgi:hypothetical protein
MDLDVACSTCGSRPAVTFARDYRRNDGPDDVFLSYEIVGEPKAGCVEHPAVSVEHPRKGATKVESD